MSRLTGTDAYGLMEAYNNVYAPQELTEEQVWEEVETWVNDLIEEGYDLSDYTWEEMYEGYIEEQGGRRGAAIGNQNVNPNASSAIGNVVKSTIGSTPAGLVARNMASRLSEPKGSGSRRGAAAGTKTPTPTFQNTGGYGRYGAPETQVKTPAPTRTPASDLKAGTRDLLNRTPAPTRTPAPAPTPTNRPVTTAPASSKPAAPAGGSALDRATAAASKPAAFSPKPQSDVGAMIARSQARQAAQTPKPATPAPAARPMGSARERMLQRQSFDVFDVIKGHLIDEGYADTEESALVIMANMSEEWRESIVENLLPSKQQIANRSSLATAKHKTSATASMERMNSRTSAPKPDMSTPKDREIGRRISQTPIGVRLTGPTGPLR